MDKLDELFELVEKNNVEAVKKLLSSELINGVDKYKYSLLHISLAKSSDDVSILLINSGIDVNLKDARGQTALHYTALFDKFDVAKRLLEAGADLGIEDDFGNQPLWTAVFNDKGFGNRLNIIGLFLSHGGNIHHKNHVGKSPLDMATIANYSAVLNILK